MDGDACKGSATEPCPEHHRHRVSCRSTAVGQERAGSAVDANRKRYRLSHKTESPAGTAWVATAAYVAPSMLSFKTANAVFVAPAHLNFERFASCSQLFGRPRQHAILESKIAVDQWLDKADVRRPKSVIAEIEDLKGDPHFAATGVAKVWSSDLGFVSAGGDDTRLVKGDQVQEAITWLEPFEGRVRIAEYISGSRASVSALVYNGQVVTFPPVARCPLVLENGSLCTKSYTARAPRIAADIASDMSASVERVA